MLLLLAALACTDEPQNNGSEPSVQDDTGQATGDDTGETGLDDTGETGETVLDEDGDGFEAEEDCDDGNASVYPGAPELCDGLDNDCEGSVDGLNVPADYSTIDEALAAATEGDMVCLAAGTYSHSGLSLDTAIHLAGYGSDQVTIQDSDGGVVLRWNSAQGFELSGMTLTGSSGRDGGVYLNEVTGRLEDVVVQGHDIGKDDNNAYGALRSFDATLELEGFSVLGTVADQRTSYNRLNGIATWFENSSVSWTGGEISGQRVDQGVNANSATNLAIGVLASHNGSLELTDLVFEDIEIDQTSAYGNGTIYGFLYLSTTEATLQDVVARDITLSTTSTSSSSGSATAVGLMHGGSSEQPFVWHGGGIEDLTVQAEALGNAYVYGVQSLVWDWQDLELHGMDLDATSSALGARCNGVYTTQQDGESSMRRVDLRGVDLSCSAAGSSESTGLLYSSHPSGSTELHNVVLAGNRVTGADTLEGFIKAWGPLTIQNATVHDNDVYVPQSGGFLAGEELTVNSSTWTRNTSASDSPDGDYPGVFVLGDSLDWSYNNSGYNSVSGATETDIAGDALSLYSQTGSVGQDGGYVDDSSSDPAGWDLSLGSGSALIDAGDSELEDPDGSRADIGAWGGPQAMGE